MSTATSFSLGRRSILKGRFDGSFALRPPGALGAGLFEEACSHCGDCALECPQAIIVADEEGFPKVDVSARGCTFCGTCAEVCEDGAILSAEGWDVRASVDDTCLSVQGVSCRTCEDHCDAGAIRFRLMTAGRAQPEVSLDDCTGCGACVAPCPSDAISLLRSAPQPSTSQPTASENQNV
ncbi:ferredoxin-type protein NapF [Shimia sp.]|uniref:ferredoxin-type protein NapF n=1 Tax=Shimia sp. TaxID=1954381 RepID=UPI003B8AB381